MGDDALLYCFGQTSRLHYFFICPTELLAVPNCVLAFTGSPFLASLLLSKRAVSSTPTFKQGGISCGKCKSVCSYQPLKACTVFCPIFPSRQLHLIMPVRSTFQISLTVWTPLPVLAGTGSDHRVPLRSQIIS